MEIFARHIAKLKGLEVLEACKQTSMWMDKYMNNLRKTERIIGIIKDVENSHPIQNYFYINGELYEFADGIRNELKNDERFDEFMKAKDKPENLKMMVKLWNECMEYLLMFEDVYHIEKVQKSFTTYGMIPAAKGMLKLYILYGNLYVYNYARLFLRKSE